MFSSTGILKYSSQDEKFDKLIVEVDQNILNYYFSVIPKYLKVNRPRYQAHISVIRKEISPIRNVWKKYQNQEIEFEYDNIIYFDELYYWLNVVCPRLCDIRVELGLTPTKHGVTFSPDERHTFHITIANRKGVI